jgi:hypothetical protein
VLVPVAPLGACDVAAMIEEVKRGNGVLKMSPDAGGKAKLRVSWAAMDECAQAAGKTMPTDLSAGYWRRCSECGDVCCEGSARLREWLGVAVGVCF